MYARRISNPIRPDTILARLGRLARLRGVSIRAVRQNLRRVRSRWIPRAIPSGSVLGPKASVANTCRAESPCAYTVSAVNTNMHLPRKSVTIESLLRHDIDRGVHPIRICEVYRLTPAQLQTRLAALVGVDPGPLARGTVAQWLRFFERRGGLL